jgi:hypothetical protein
MNMKIDQGFNKAVNCLEVRGELAIVPRGFFLECEAFLFLRMRGILKIFS